MQANSLSIHLLKESISLFGFADDATGLFLTMQRSELRHEELRTAIAAAAVARLRHSGVFDPTSTMILIPHMRSLR